ncbi:MAG: NAD(P)/FAD-dependent oxidoreductase [Desulfuromonadales bacterium]
MAWPTPALYLCFMHYTRKRILILGGGPAGSATAVALSQHGIDAELILAFKEKSRDPIGETIPPAATHAMKQLGLEGLLDENIHLPCPGSASIWGSETPGHNDFFIDPTGKGFHLDRARFDADLRRAAGQAGTQLQSGWRLQKVEALSKKYRLWFSTPQKEMTPVEADLVIDATGQAAAFARRLGVARNLFDEVISVCAFINATCEPPESAHTFIQTRDIGWWYGARLPGKRGIVALCTDRQTLQAHSLADPEQWRTALTQTKWFKEQMQQQLGSLLPESSRLFLKPAPSAILSNVIGPNWLAVGDAASSYDSMTSAGITKALLQAHQAGQAVAEWLRDGSGHALHDFQNQVFDDFNQYMQLHQQHYRSETRFGQSAFWRNRLRHAG